MLPLCLEPWVNVTLTNQGVIGPCCVTPPEGSTLPDSSSQSIVEYLKSNELTKFKDTLSRGLWPKRCLHCKLQEDSNLPSRRVRKQNTFKKYYDKENINLIKVLDLSLSNLCNTKCIHCRPSYSSMWENDLKRKNLKPIFQLSETESFVKRTFNINLIKELLDQPHDLQNIIFKGGEPLLNSNSITVLELLLEKNLHTKTKLTFVTNGTVSRGKIFSLISRFKKVEFFVSVDGDRYTNHLIRGQNSDLRSVTENINKYKQFGIINHTSISTTIHILNLERLIFLINWANEIKADCDLSNILTFPPILSIYSIPKEVLNIYLDFLCKIEANKLNQKHANTIKIIISVLQNKKQKNNNFSLEDWASTLYEFANSNIENFDNYLPKLFPILNKALN